MAHTLLDMYGSTLGHSDAIDELFLKLHRQVKAELGFQRRIMHVMGALDGIINSALVGSEKRTGATGATGAAGATGATGAAGATGVTGATAESR